MAIRFHLDEQIKRAIAEGLRRRGIDVTTTADAALIGAADLVHLVYARQQQRIIFTSDADFLRLHEQGIQHAGIVFSHTGTKTVGQIIEFLTLVHACFNETEMVNRIEFF
jgi:predicted nuclease of predicted toxin-antitoxin system